MIVTHIQSTKKITNPLLEDYDRIYTITRLFAIFLMVGGDKGHYFITNYRIMVSFVIK
jgi:hypothetical protein